jgi:ABC-type oligopeptide transport system ATPase subunit
VTEPVLRIEGLTIGLPVGADRRHAVEDVNLAVEPGQIVCLVGESGSGKSVTAHGVMGLLPKGQLTPLGGRIALQGEDLLSAAESRLRDLRCTAMSGADCGSRRSRPRPRVQTTSTSTTSPRAFASLGATSATLPCPRPSSPQATGRSWAWST